jgi:hypothetical protein
MRFAAGSPALSFPKRRNRRGRLLLPGALLVTVRTKLFAALMLVDFRFTAFLE